VPLYLADGKRQEGESYEKAEQVEKAPPVNFASS